MSDILAVREEFYSDIKGQSDQTEFLVHKLREFRDPVTDQFRFFLPKV